MTSSYSRRCLRISKLCVSTRFWAVLDRARHEPVLDRLALLHPQAVHDLLDPLGAEDPEEVVLEREVEARRAGVALAPGAAAELVVDPPRLVALGADDVQPAQLDHPLRAPARWSAAPPASARGALLRGRRRRVEAASCAASPWRGSPGCRRAGCRCRGRPCWWRWSPRPPARLGHDLGLALVVLRVEHLVVRTPRFLRSLESRSDFSMDTVPDQHRLALLVAAP